MKNYIVTYYFKAEQYLVVENCRSKKEAIKKARTPNDPDVDAFGYEVIKVFESTIKAKVDGN